LNYVADGFRPNEGLEVGIVALNLVADRSFEFPGFENATPNDLRCDQFEQALDKIQPR
jgi:hypothetical protein